MTRGKALTFLGVVLAAFLGGFVPQYLENGRLRTEVEKARGAVRSLESAGKRGQLRDLAALMHVEVSRNNYGLAAQHASRFFDLARELSSAPEGAAIQETLTAVLAQRDAVTSALAKADPAAAAPVQSILLQVQAAGR